MLFNRRDFGAYLALIDPEVEWSPYEVWVRAASLTGATPVFEAGGRRLSRSSLISGQRSMRYETSETGRSRAGAFAGRGRGAVRRLSGPCGSQTNGVIKRTVWASAFGSETEALEAAGLSE